MFISPILIVRIFQGVLALIAMALGATVANVLNTHHPFSLSVPAAVVFYIFTTVFTMLIIVPYTILTPRYFPTLAHPYAMLVAEGITSVFWLAGFAAVADKIRKADLCDADVGACSSATGSVVVGVFEFLLFGVTTFFAVSHVFLGGRYGLEKPAVAKRPQIHRTWTGAERV